MRNETVEPMILPSGVELERKRTPGGTITTIIPKEHWDEYGAEVVRRGIEAGKSLGILK